MRIINPNPYSNATIIGTSRINGNPIYFYDGACYQIDYDESARLIELRHINDHMPSFLGVISNESQETKKTFTINDL